MDTTFISIILLVVVLYTLYYTYFFDRGMFLFIIVLILLGLWVSQFVNEKISGIGNDIKNIIVEQIANVKNISSNLLSNKMQNFVV